MLLFKSMKIFLKKYFKYFIFFILLIIILNLIYSKYRFYKKYDNEYIYHATIISKDSQDEDSITYLAKIGEGLISEKILINIYISSYDEYLNANKEELFFNRFENFNYNDVVYVKGNLYDSANLNNDYEFDYKEYLSSRGIVGTVYVNEVEYIYSKKTILNYLYEYKESFDNYISSNMLYHEGLFKTIVYGDDLNLSTDTKDMFVSVGQSITLSVSGTNIFSIYLIISNFLLFFNTKVFKIKDKKFKVFKNIICVIFYYLYYIFCDYKISILRVVVMYSLASILDIFNIKIYSIKKLILSTIIIFFINPYVLISVSFLLGTVANIGIYTLNDKLKKFVYFKVSKIGYVSNKDFNILNKVLKSVINCICFYLSCNIYIIPIQAYYFNYFNLTSVVSNLFITILYFYQVFIGTLLMMFFKIPVISNILMFLSNILTYLIYNIIEVLTNITVDFNFASPSILTIISYYILILLITYMDKVINIVKNIFNSNNNKCELSNYNKRKRAKTIVNIIILITFLITIISYIYTAYFNVFVYHFSVGQGNMSIIKNMNIAVVFDIGSTSYSNVDDIIYNYMMKKNISDIDYLVISHFHQDHVNALYELEDKILSGEIIIKNVIYTIPKDTTGYYEFIEFVDKYNINKIVACKDETLCLGDDFKLEFLSPSVNYNIVSSDEMNSNSLVTLVTLYDTYHLFLGDATIESEQYIMNNLTSYNEINDKLNNLTSYVVGHHGSSSSSSLEFLNFTSSKYYIISAKKSMYNHPSIEVIERFDLLDLNYHITEEEGGLFIKIK